MVGLFVPSPGHADVHRPVDSYPPLCNPRPSGRRPEILAIASGCLSMRARWSVLAGVRDWPGKFINSDIVKAARPIYRARTGFFGQRGTETAGRHRVRRSGYAVGCADGESRGRLMPLSSVTFMKVVNGCLDPTDAYESNWILAINPSAPAAMHWWLV